MNLLTLATFLWIQNIPGTMGILVWSHKHEYQAGIEVNWNPWIIWICFPNLLFHRQADSQLESRGTL